MAQYCTPEANCTVGDGFELVEINTFSNASTCESDMGVPGYGDFTDLTGLFISPGVPVPVSFSSGFGNQFASIWIDLDNSETFDADELVLADVELTTAGEVYSAEFTLDGATPQGSYRLRAQAAYFSNSSEDPCVQPVYGETEDYTVLITEPPSCFSVLGIQVVNELPNSLEVEWDNGGNAEAWDIEYGLEGFTPTGTPSPGFDDVMLPIVIPGLAPATTYDIYVRGDCGMDNTDVSFWSSSVEGTTACATITPSYAEDFEDIELNCWEEATGGSPLTTYETLGDATWITDQDGDGSGQLYGMEFFDNTHNEWLISPIFDLSAGEYTVEFDISMYQGFILTQGSLGSDDLFGFLISEDNGASWTVLEEWDSGTNALLSGEHRAYELSDYDSPTTRFAFWGFGGTVSDFNFMTLGIDDFYIGPSGESASIIAVSTIEVNCFDPNSGAVYLDLLGGVGPYLYSWNSGQATEDLINVPAGDYVITVTDGQGGTFISDTITVGSESTMVVDAAITNESIDGAADGAIDITVTGGNPPYSYQWNNGVTQEDLSDIIDALWCVNVTDADFCVTTACFLVETDPLSVESYESVVAFMAYPNPTQGDLELLIQLDSPQDVIFRLLDLQGRVCIMDNQTGLLDYRGVMDMGNLSKGVYILDVRTVEGAPLRTVQVVRQ